VGCAVKEEATGECEWLCLSSWARARRCCCFILAAELSVHVEAPYIHTSSYTCSKLRLQTPLIQSLTTAKPITG